MEGVHPTEWKKEVALGDKHLEQLLRDLPTKLSLGFMRLYGQGFPTEARQGGRSRTGLLGISQLSWRREVKGSLAERETRGTS